MSSDAKGSSESIGLGFGPMILVVLAAAVIVMAGTREIAGLIGPVFLALTLAVSARPAMAWLRRHGMPRALTTIVVLAGLYAVLLGMVLVIGIAVAELANTLPSYGGRFSGLFNQGIAELARHGFDTQAARDAVRKFDITSLIGVAQSLAAGLTSTFSLLLFMLLSLAFLILDTSDVSARTSVLRRVRPLLADALSDFAWRVRKYWVYSAIFGLILAAGDYVALLVIGVPLALSWALLAFICNFIPNIGFAIALVPPTLLALLDSGPGKALAVLISYAVISFVVQTLMLPRFMGNAVGLNTTTTFMSLVFWASVVGPLGAVLAIPLTLFCKAVLIDATPGLRWVGVFLSNEPTPAETVRMIQ